MNVKNKAVKKNQSLGRALQIIEVMAHTNGPMRLQDISKAIKLPASTVLRFLDTLTEHDYVQQDPVTSRYYLTMKFCQIGYLINSQISIRDISRPYLDALSKKCQESACLAIEQDLRVVYIDVVNGPDNLLQTLQRIGKVAPLHSTGVGKTLLSDFVQQKLDIFIEERGLKALTKNTLTTKQGLFAELKKIKSSGYAIDDEECEEGVRCVAAPLKNYTGKIIASISISAPVSRMPIEKIAFIKKQILKTASELSKLFGYQKQD